MSVPAVGWARHQGRAKNLPTFARMLLLTLADILGATGRLCPSEPYLSAETGMSVKTVRKFLIVLRDADLIDWTKSIGNVTHYRLLRVEPRQDVPGYDTPARRAPVTQVRRAGGNGAHPGKPGPEPRQDRELTPARRAPEPSKNQEEPKTRAQAPAKGSEVLTLEEVGKKAAALPPASNSSDPLDQPVDPERVRTVLAQVRHELRMRAYPPRAATMDREDQIAATLGPRRDKPHYLAAEQLVAARRIAGIGAAA